MRYVSVTGVLEYHVVLVNRVQIRNIKDVSHWIHAGSLIMLAVMQEVRSTAFSLGLVMTISQEVHNPVIDS